MREAILSAHADHAKTDCWPVWGGEIRMSYGKTLHTSTVSKAKTLVADLITYGDSDTFKLICKASSEAEGWMKSTKAMEIPGVGCVVQVTTQQGDHVAEALTFVPGVRIEYMGGDRTKGRRLVKDVAR